MTYEELWQTAHAIGYHAGMVPEGEATDKAALGNLMDMADRAHHGTAKKRYEDGRKEGADNRRTR